MVATYGVSGAISGQAHSQVESRTFNRTTGARGVIHCPGYGSVADSYLSADYAIVKAVVERGRPMASFPHGTNWGNSTAQGYISNLRTYGQANWGFASGTVDLICGSAGAAAGLNWAKANPTLVRRIALLIPAVDLQDIHANNRNGYAASIAAAWGGSAPSDANNPADNTASFTGFPIAIWYSTSDTICTQTTVEAFGSAVGATMHSLGAVGHSTGGLDAQQVADFLS